MRAFFEHALGVVPHERVASSPVRSLQGAPPGRAVASAEYGLFASPVEGLVAEREGRAMQATPNRWVTPEGRAFGHA